MAHGVNKYLFALGISIFFILMYFKSGRSVMNTENLILKVAFPNTSSITTFEPTNILLAPQYALLENLYSPLIELSPNGELQSGVAQSFEWHGDELHFEIRKNLVTIDGHQITAYDAEFSLKRLMILTGNTHGDLKNILCNDMDLKTIDDPCPHLESRNKYLLVLKPNRKDVFLVKMLSAIDFSIIPKTSVDPKTLKIIDYRNTSGPFYVKHDDPEGKIILATNPNHYHYSPKIPQLVKLVPTDDKIPNKSLVDFDSGSVDYITEADSTLSEKIFEYSKSHSNETNLHSTINIRMFVLSFTKKGLNTINKRDRLLIGKKIKSIFRNLLNIRGLYEPSDQFFPAFGEGSLDTKKIESLNEVYNTLDEKETINLKDISIGFIRMGDLTKYTTPLHAEFPDFEMFSFKRSDAGNKNPDIIIAGPDTGFLEDIVKFPHFSGHKFES